jgi:hypothetical protein
MAVGRYYAINTGQNLALAETWDGTDWTLQSTADPSTDGDYLNAVSCLSPTNCSAAGFDGDNDPAPFSTLAESWNGSTWSVQATPNPPGSSATEFLADSCGVSGPCDAVGFSQDTMGRSHTLVESLDGTSWSIDSSIDPLGAVSNDLQSVSCTSPTWCASSR